jgi:ABC-type nitrate/sulfonate/bicarbonate transport system ATPase subunit
MAAPALRVVDASKAFERGGTELVAFDGVDLEVARGEILALLGPSGCGKSTLLRAIAGLDELDRGRIEIADGRDREHAIGIAFQQPSLLPWLTVSGNIELGLRFAANRDAATDDIVNRTIVEVGLESCADAFPDELSGGQAQRANVARLVVTERPILLLDEPFAALDPSTRAGLQDWILELALAHGLTVVIVTHDVSEALRIGDRIALMSGAPGSIGRVWDVREIVGNDREPVAIESLRREILATYDADPSPERIDAAARLTAGHTTDLQGATS